MSCHCWWLGVPPWRSISWAWFSLRYARLLVHRLARILGGLHHHKVSDVTRGIVVVLLDAASSYFVLGLLLRLTIIWQDEGLVLVMLQLFHAVLLAGVLALIAHLLQFSFFRLVYLVHLRVLGIQSRAVLEVLTVGLSGKVLVGWLDKCVRSYVSHRLFVCAAWLRNPHIWTNHLGWHSLLFVFVHAVVCTKLILFRWLFLNDEALVLSVLRLCLVLWWMFLVIQLVLHLIRVTQD